jgi:hypothetical protein
MLPERNVMSWLALTTLLMFLAVSGCGRAFGEGMTAAGVAAELRGAGMPIASARTLTARTDPNELLGRPGLYTSKVFFADRRLGRTDKYGVRRTEADAGGSIEVFENEGDAKRRAEYVQGITSRGGPFAEYSYRRGAVFLRLSRSLTPHQAKGYERALNELP